MPLFPLWAFMACSMVNFTFTFTSTAAPNTCVLAYCHPSCAKNFKMAPRVLKSLCVPALKRLLFCVSTKTQVLSLMNHKPNWLQIAKSQIATTQQTKVVCNMSCSHGLYISVTNWIRTKPYLSPMGCSKRYVTCSGLNGPSYIWK
jgi:hypothetical protein